MISIYYLCNICRNFAYLYIIFKVCRNPAVAAMCFLSYLLPPADSSVIFLSLINVYDMMLPNLAAKLSNIVIIL